MASKHFFSRLVWLACLWTLTVIAASCMPPGDPGTNRERAGNFTPRNHYLSVMVLKNNIPHGREIIFTVVS